MNLVEGQIKGVTCGGCKRVGNEDNHNECKACRNFSCDFCSAHVCGCIDADPVKEAIKTALRLVGMKYADLADMENLMGQEALSVNEAAEIDFVERRYWELRMWIDRYDLFKTGEYVPEDEQMIVYPSRRVSGQVN